MLKELKSNLGSHLNNALGWTTKKRIIVFESDDWGSIRTSDKNALNTFRKKGMPIDKDPYTLYDSLESNTDLELLFGVINSFKDKNKNNPKFTLNNIVANPDFKKIKSSNFNEYHYELFIATLEKYNDSDKVFSLYKKALDEKLISIQFHGREHLQVNNWINKLKKNEKNSLVAFNNNMFTYYPKVGANCFDQNLDAFGCYSEKDFLDLPLVIEDGLRIFEEIWGYKSQSVVCPCHIWNQEIEHTFEKLGINQIQSGPKQTIPKNNPQTNKQIRQYTGKLTKDGILMTARNVTFEPSIFNSQPVEKALKSIQSAFFWNKPAIISSHRLNFIGRIDEKNRDKNLVLLQNLIHRILSIWPNTEFMSSDELGELIWNDILKTT